MPRSKNGVVRFLVFDGGVLGEADSCGKVARQEFPKVAPEDPGEFRSFQVLVNFRRQPNYGRSELFDI